MQLVKRRSSRQHLSTLLNTNNVHWLDRLAQSALPMPIQILMAARMGMGIHCLGVSRVVQHRRASCRRHSLLEVVASVLNSLSENDKTALKSPCYLEFNHFLKVSVSSPQPPQYAYPLDDPPSPASSSIPRSPPASGTAKYKSSSATVV